MLRRRAARMQDDVLDLDEPMAFESSEQQAAAIKFFNAAIRAEESGLRQAHELAGTVAEWDPDLAEVLRLYGNEEGWHEELLGKFLAYLGGEVQPMGRVTGLLYRLYARAERMETIVLTNLMFETIGSTTYRLALRRARHPTVRQMLVILTRDESFHVPLNVHFLREVLGRRSRAARLRLAVIYQILFASLVALPIASRPKAQRFDQIGLGELSRAYAESLAALFADETDPVFDGLRPPRPLLWLLGVREPSVREAQQHLSTSVAAAERAVDRDHVQVA